MRDVGARLGLVAFGLIAALGLGGWERQKIVGPTRPPTDPKTSDLDYLLFHDDGAPAADAICARVAGLQPPAADRPNAAAARSLKGCESVRPYYGLGEPVDPVRARLCAFVETAAVEAGDASPGLGAQSILASVYANGQGVRRDLDLATHFACQIESDSVHDRVERVMSLQKLKASGARKRFDYCDQPMSDFTTGECAWLEGEKAKAAQDRKIAAVAARWTPGQRAAFQAMRKAEETFASSRAEDERDNGGTDRFYMGPANEAAVREAGFQLFQALDAGRLPAASPQALAAAEAELNAQWRKLMAKDDIWDGTMSRDSLRQSQRNWLAYRQAWEAFARAIAPASADRVRLRLTRSRNVQLACMVRNDGDEC